MLPNATIRDVLSILNDPEDFIRGIVGSFIQEQFDKERAIIRIGTSGSGASPNYCIQQDSVNQKLSVHAIKVYEKRSVFNGRSHKLILEDDAMGIRWGGNMSFAEVQALLGEVRSSKRRN